jgi:hypothetical protein
MPGWNEASVDELLADPIVRDLMAADGVDPAELRALLYDVQRTIERYATTRGGPASLAGFAQLHRSTPRSSPPAPGSTLRADRGRLANHSKLSIAPIASMFCGGAGAPSGVRQ